VDAIHAVGDSLESIGGAKKAMEGAAPARAEQEYPLAIVVSGKALVAEASTGSCARTDALALEEFEREEAERQVRMDTMLGGLGRLHRVSCRFLCISHVGL
jgi:hypothetical protein